MYHSRLVRFNSNSGFSLRLTSEDLGVIVLSRWLEQRLDWLSFCNAKQVSSLVFVNIRLYLCALKKKTLTKFIDINLIKK